MGTVPLAHQYRESHRQALALVAELSDEDLAWRPAPWAHSVGWNLWQMARWADQLQARLSRIAVAAGSPAAPGRLIWEAEGLAARWGFEPDDREHSWPETPPAGLATATLPGKSALLAYAHDTFAAAEQALEAVAAQERTERAPDGLLDSPTGPGYAIAECLVQENRRLGEIESVRYLQHLL
jgi:hypothetical protein